MAEEKENERKSGARSSSSEESDVEELRGIFNVITEFIKNIKGEIKDIIVLSVEALDGAKLGEEVSKFYKSLKESGMPEEVAEEMVKEYFRKRIEAVPNLGNLLSKIGLSGEGLGKFKELAKTFSEGKGSASPGSKEEVEEGSGEGKD